MEYSVREILEKVWTKMIKQELTSEQRARIKETPNDETSERLQRIESAIDAMIDIANQQAEHNINTATMVQSLVERVKVLEGGEER